MHVNLYTENHINGCMSFKDLFVNCVKYNGICAQYLFKLDDDNMSLSTLMLGRTPNDDMVQFINFIEANENLISEQCAMVLMPFLCQHTFPPCDSEGNANLLSQAECRNIQDFTCATEWRMIMTTSFSTLLPVCEDLSDADFGYYNSQMAMKPLQCPKQFKDFCGMCLPLCGEFSRYDDETKIQQKSMIITTAAMNDIGGILVFILAVLRRKEL